MKKVSLIVPIYNEEETLLETLKKIEQSNTFHLEKEVILVDDGSIDNTRNILKNLENKYKVFYHETNRGKGAALKTGLQGVSGDIILIQDADLEYNPKEYPNLLKPILENKTEVVYGSRHLTPNPRFNLKYYWGNKLTNLLLNLCYNSHLTDFWTGYKVFKTQVIKSIELESNRFDIEIEITANLLREGHKILEVPISYFPRDFKAGKKIRSRDGLFAIWKIMKYRLSR